MCFDRRICTKLHHKQKKGAFSQQNYPYTQQTHHNHSKVYPAPERGVEDLDNEEKEVKCEIQDLHPTVWMPFMRLLHGALHLN